MFRKYRRRGLIETLTLAVLALGGFGVVAEGLAKMQGCVPAIPALGL